MSDLHINTGYTEPVPPENSKEITLVIPGDICEIRHAKLYREYVSYLSKTHKMVLISLGNHEYYFGSLSDGARQLREILEDLENVVIMDRKVVEVDNVTFIGATLWTDLNHMNPIDVYAVNNGLNDFRFIRYGPPDDMYKFLFSPVHCEFLHKQDLAFIQTSLTKVKTEKIVVMTHHAPSRKSIAPKWMHSNINAGFCNDLDEFILNNKIDLFVHGHMHDSFDYYIGKTRVVCNPKGYGNENSDFNPNLILDL